MKCGGHWNPHGGRNNDESHAGDLGNITANEKKIANFRFTTSKLTLFGDVEDSIVGRSIVIHKDEDDNGKGGHVGARLDCVIVNNYKFNIYNEFIQIISKIEKINIYYHTYSSYFVPIQLFYK